MTKIILYSSNQLLKIPVTGGIRRFKELMNELGKYCDLTIMSGDEVLSITNGDRHISMHHKEVGRSEIKLAFWNYKYLKQIKREKYDRIISFDVPPSLWLALFGMPHLCLMVRKDFIGYEKIKLDEAKTGKIKRIVYLCLMSLCELITALHAEKIILQCEYDKRELIKRHKIFGKRIENKSFVQINNVNPSWAVSSDISCEENTDFIVGSVNDLSGTRKGCDLFLQAVSELLDEGYNLKAYIAGDGEYFSYYKEKYASYKNIIFSGRTSDPMNYIKKFSLAVVPSRADSCPNTILEALYSHVPVIGSNAGGIPEILDNDDALFSPDADVLKERIIYFSDYENRNNLLQQQNKRTKELSFDWVQRIYHIVIE